MKEEVDIVISTENNVRVNLCEWDDGGVWLYLQGRQASMSTTLTRSEAEQMLAGLQALLAKEVTA
jgi:hypothetical protein